VAGRRPRRCRSYRPGDGLTVSEIRGMKPVFGGAESIGRPSPCLARLLSEGDRPRGLTA
jgi:hypothetical protein